MNLESKELVNTVVDLIQSKKGYDINILDLRKLSAMSDYFVICTADADTQVKAIADEIDRSLRKDGIKCHTKEGYNSLNWVLLDYFDVVVHIFKSEARNFYNLEKLWGDADLTQIDNNT
jgi:ribosome-associated protein